jgi:hypothetical protein
MLARRRLTGLATAVVIATVQIATGHDADARSCVEDTLRSKSEDGDILIMMSGAVYEVLPGDSVDSALWLPPEEVLICEAPLVYRGRNVIVYDIINTDEGEKVGAHRLR